jgi:uncharacterized protein (TIGR02444 family)
MTVAQDAAAELWEFATRLYAAPGVSAACLALQEAHGVDVPLMLAAAWAGLTRRGRLDAAALAALDAEIAPLRRAVIQRLREARRWLKPQAALDPVLAVLRARIQAVELDVERALLDRLAVRIAARSPCADADVRADARANVAAALRHFGAADGCAALEDALVAFPSDG